MRRWTRSPAGAGGLVLSLALSGAAGRRRSTAVLTFQSPPYFATHQNCPGVTATA